MLIVVNRDYEGEWCEVLVFMPMGRVQAYSIHRAMQKSTVEREWSSNRTHKATGRARLGLMRGEAEMLKY